MKDACVLIADNDPDSLAIVAEFLRLADYRVLTADSSQQVRQILSTSRVHLVILDLRLTNDDDVKDKSGLTLAREIAPSIPKIILTKFPTYQDVREIMKLDMAALPPAIDFLNKGDGRENLIAAVEQAINQYSGINWNLIIRFDEMNPLSFVHLVNLVELGLEGEQLIDRAEEMKDLFRRLFYEKTEIKIGRLIWQLKGRIAVSVFEFAEGKTPESSVVVCGRQEEIKDESRRSKDYAAKALGSSATIANRTNDTTHFAANAYALAGTDLENTHSLIDLYRTGPEKSFNAVLSNLYEHTLADWSHEKSILEEHRTLDELYRTRLNLTAERQDQVADRVQALVRQMPTLGLKIERGTGAFTLRFGGQSFSYPDPAPIIYQKSPIGQPVLLSNTPGMLSGENILTDESSRAWLTDFAGAGLAPVLWNFVTLEAAIRFDWVAFDWIETYKLQWLHELEQTLVEGHFSRLESSEVEPPLRKPLRAIRMIRQLAAEAVGQDTLPYHFGMLFHAASRLAEFNPDAPHTSKELARPAHAMIAAAMICRKIMQTNRAVSASVDASVSGIRIDKDNYEVWVDGEKTPLGGQSYDLLCYLHEHVNQIRTRRDIIEHVFQQQYDPDNSGQYELVNTAISRLREKLEADAKRPRHLKTVKGRGYRLES